MRVALLCALGVAVCGSLVGAPPPNRGAEPREPVLHAGTREVVLDMIVRDKHGHLVKNLKPDQIQVYEDSVRQTIKSFRFVQGSEQLQAEKAAQAEDRKRAAGLEHPLNSTREVNFVSIVFAQMKAGDRAFARDAAVQFLHSGSLTDTFVAIYRLDRSLHLIQPYTNDRHALMAAAKEATARLSPARADQGTLSAVNTASEAAIIALGKPSAAGGNKNGPLSINLNGAAAQSPLIAGDAGAIGAATDLNSAIQTEAQLEDRLRFAENQANGMDTLDALRALVRSQFRIQGRKVVIYLSDGLALPANRRSVFDGVIGLANRSNVTFYTVDTRGLSLERPTQTSLAQLAQATAVSTNQERTTATGDLDFDTAHEFDTLDLAGVSNTQAALGELAHATGGFAVANTNEIAKPMQRVMEDIRTHYEVSYTPSSNNYDGHFRKIGVKIADRRKLRIQTRSGYYALPDLNGQPIEPFEMAALKAVRERPLPHALAYQAELMQFRPGQNGSECELGFEIPISGLKFVSDAKTRQARIHASVFALIHDAKGQIVDKISRDLAREIPISKVAKIRHQTITYIQPVKLPAGHYTIDTAVVDEQASKASAKRLAAFVNAANHIALSSITVVKRFEPLKTARDPLNPFDLAHGRILPAVDNRAPGSKPANVYFVVYPAKAGGAAKPMAIVQLFENGAEIARQTPALPAPEKDGSIPVIAQLSLKPGQYQIRVTVRQGTNAAQSSSALTVE